MVVFIFYDMTINLAILLQWSKPYSSLAAYKRGGKIKKSIAAGARPALSIIDNRRGLP
jgi:hypothetical protein